MDIEIPIYNNNSYYGIYISMAELYDVIKESKNTGFILQSIMSDPRFNKRFWDFMVYEFVDLIINAWVLFGCYEDKPKELKEAHFAFWNRLRDRLREKGHFINQDFAD